jgi:hypothetical protein
MLDTTAIESFHSFGYLIVRGAVDETQLRAMREELARWVKDSRGPKATYGAMARGKLRFDREPGSTAEHPRLRSGSAELPPAYGADSFFSVQGQGETVE